MLKPAARRGDTTAHGGTIVGGEPTVMIGGRWAARIGDPHVCSLSDGPKPHVGGVIVTASSTVMIGGAYAARVGDFCGCPSAGTVGAAVPAAVGLKPEIITSDGPSDADYFQTNNARTMHAEREYSDTDNDGTYDTVKASSYVAKVETKRDVDIGSKEVGAEYKQRIGYLEAEGSASADTGGSVAGGLELGAHKQSLKLWLGDASDNGTNPDVSILGEWDLFHAEGKVDALAGDDGRRIGARAMGKAGAEVIAGKVVGTVNATRLLDPLGLLDELGYSLELSAEVGGSSITSPGGGAGAHAYYDRADERYKVGVLGKLAVVVFGVEGQFDASFGKKRVVPGTGAGGVPNPIIVGELTVLIGG